MRGSGGVVGVVGIVAWRPVTVTRRGRMNGHGAGGVSVMVGGGNSRGRSARQVVEIQEVGNAARCA